MVSRDRDFPVPGFSRSYPRVLAAAQPGYSLTMNPRVTPVSRPGASTLNGKNGISPALNNGGGVIATHLKAGEGSVSKNYDPGHLDIVRRSPSGSPGPSRTASTTSAQLNVKVSSGAVKLTAGDQKMPKKPMIAVSNLSVGEVTYSDAEAIMVTSDKNKETKLKKPVTTQNGGTPERNGGLLREKPKISQHESSPFQDQLQRTTIAQGNGNRVINGTNSSNSKERDIRPSSVASDSSKKGQPAGRSHSFHADMAKGQARNEVVRSRSLSRDVVAFTDNLSGSSPKLDQDQRKSRMDKYTTSLPASPTAVPSTAFSGSPTATVRAGTGYPSTVPTVSRPAISSSGGSKRDLGHGLSVRFADFTPDGDSETSSAAGEKNTKVPEFSAPSFLSHVTTSSVDSVLGVDAAIRLCNNSTSKKIYIDTVRKPVSEVPSQSSPTFHHGRSEGRGRGLKDTNAASPEGSAGTTCFDSGQDSSPDTAYFKKNGFQLNRLGFYSQGAPPTSTSAPTFQKSFEHFVPRGSAEGTEGDLASSNVSPTGSFGSPSPLRALEHLSPFGARSNNYTISPLVQTSSSGAVNHSSKLSNNGHWSLTPSSSLSSTSSSLSKEAATATPASSSTSPSTPVAGLHPQHRHRLPSGACADEPPFSLMLLSSSSSSSLLLPTSSPSSSPTTVAGAPPSSSSSHPSPSVPGSSSSGPGVPLRPPASAVSSRPSSACLRSDCVLPGINLRTISQLDLLLSPPSRHKHPPRPAQEAASPGSQHHPHQKPFSLDLSSPETKPKLPPFHLPLSADSPSDICPMKSKQHQTGSPKPFPSLTSPSLRDAGSLGLRKSLLTSSASSSSDVGSSISSSATSLSSGKQLHQMYLQHNLHFPFPPGVSPSSSPSLSSKTASDSRGSLASLIKKESIAASYQLEYCWFCGRPMPPFGARCVLRLINPSPFFYTHSHSPHFGARRVLSLIPPPFLHSFTLNTFRSKACA